MRTSRFVLGLKGPILTESERLWLQRRPPFGLLLAARNLQSAEGAATLVEEIRRLASPPPLLFVEQEGGSVDRMGPLLGVPLPSASYLGGKGAFRIQEVAYLTGRACRLLGLDVNLAPVVDLWQPAAAGVLSADRTFAFHAEDVALAGMVFLHGLARAGLAAFLKHFPGQGRAAAVPGGAGLRVDAHDVDLMVTDVAPFTRLARLADGVVLSHAAFPGFTGDETPASRSPRVHEILRGPVGFAGVSCSDDLSLDAYGIGGEVSGLAGARSVGLAATAGCDLLCFSGPAEEIEEAMARIDEPEDAARTARLEALRDRCASAPRPAFSRAAWTGLADEVRRLLEDMEKPPAPREEPEEEDATAR